MRASYQDATCIYVQRMRFYYSALLITRTNSPQAVSVADLTPHRRDDAAGPPALTPRGNVRGNVDAAAAYPPPSAEGPHGATSTMASRHARGPVHPRLVSS